MRVAILGLGTATPAQSITQADAAAWAKTLCCATDEQAALLPTLYRRTRVHKRGSVLLERSARAQPQQSFFVPAEHEADRGPTTAQRMRRYAMEAPRLALTASRSALAESRLSAAQVSHLVTVSCTGFVAPGTDLILMNELGCAPTVGRTHIGFMGCHGAFNGLRVAAAFVDADPEARALLCSVELCSLHFRYGWDPEHIVANALFADGAGALIVAPSSHARPENWTLIATGSCVFPDSAEAMAWRIGDYGFEMTLSARVPTLIATHLRPWLERWLRSCGLTIQDLQSWAIHPGGPRILSTVAACLELPERALEASQAVLRECGNMSSATLLFILQHLRRAQAPRPCVALGFGPGLAVEAALFV